MEAPITLPTFDNFMVGKSNELAYAAAMAFAAKPEPKNNPLFIYGDKGLGKTHLLHGIRHYVSNYIHGARVLYYTSENFSIEAFAEIKNDKLQRFHNKTRSVDLFLMDDIEFIGGRANLEEQFFHLYNCLYSEGKQLVVTSTKPPREIPLLAERLRWRLESGLIVDILPPDHELRAAFLRRRAQDLYMECPEDVADFIAQKITTNFYDLEDMLIRIVKYARQQKKEISMELFDSRILSSPPEPPEPPDSLGQKASAVTAQS